MRGKRISRAARKIDVVIESARYEKSRKQVALARGFKRRGFVWGDRVLFDRDALIEMIQSKQDVFAGRPASLEGDFELIAPIHLKTTNGDVALLAEGYRGEGDDLGLPLF